MALNETIKWKPASTGTGRFGKWLENVQDWNLSRSRYWGTPLPIWRTADGKEEICIGSYQELCDEVDKAVAAGVMTENPLKAKGFVPGVYTKENYDRFDIHRPYVDELVLVSPSGQPMRLTLRFIILLKTRKVWRAASFIPPTSSLKAWTRRGDGSSRFMP